MEYVPLCLATAPNLTDDAAAEVIEFLHELTTAMENHYYAQLHRRQQMLDENQQHPDLFDSFEDDELPNF
jgi:hypothetical protein